MGRPSSPIRYSDRRNNHHNSQYADGSPINHRRHRSRSPSYARYSPEHRRRKSPVSRRSPSRSRSRSPDRRKPIPRRENYNSRRDGGNYGGKIVAEEESDEELRGLSFEEYRRLKRQKLRRSLKISIWNVTPSPPPRSQNDAIDNEFESKEVESESESESESEGKEKKSSRVMGTVSVTDDRVTKLGKDRESGLESESGSGSGSDSDSDSDSRSRKRSKSSSKRSRGSTSKRRKSKSKSRKSYDSEEEESDEEEESSEEDRKRRKSKSKRGSSSRKKKSSSRRKSRRRRSKDSETEDESESEKGKRSKNNKKKTLVESSEEDIVSGKSVSDVDETAMKAVDESNVDDVEINPIKEVLEAEKMAALLENEAVVGPQPLPKAEGHISYGGALRPGEGDAIAQYVQQGKRIPRRGEVGLSADEISKYEDLGYVMSGSRHQRMNAIRIRKENQVYSAEDKRALAMYNFEEKAKREGKVMEDLKRLVQRTIGEDVVPNHHPFGAKDEGEE